MGRGVSAGGGQSSLGYLFGGGEETTTNTKGPQAPQNDPKPSNADPSPKPAAASPPAGARTAGVHSSTTNNYMRADGQNCGNFLTHDDRIPKPAAVSPPPGARTAGIHSSTTNNYMRADGQNCGNFLTERPSTKVHAAPGGGSSLGYLFGDGKK